MENDFYNPRNSDSIPRFLPSCPVPNIPRDRCSTCPRSRVSRLSAICTACRKLDKCLPTIYEVIHNLRICGRAARCTIIEGEDLCTLVKWAVWTQEDFTKDGDAPYWDEFIFVVDYFLTVAESYIDAGCWYSPSSYAAPCDMVEKLARVVPGIRPYR